MSTDKRVVLVTGANKGIGYEAVKLLSQKIPHGQIILTTRSIKNGEDALAKMRASQPSHKFENVTLLELEITDTKSLSKAAEKVKSDFGKLDVLLHNSAIASADGDGNSKKILDTNVQGAHDTVQAFLPLIPKDGLVVVVSSEVGAWSTNAFNLSLQQRLTSSGELGWTDVQALSDDWVAYAQGKEHVEQWPEISNPKNALHGGYTVSKAFLSAWLRAFALQHHEVQVAIVCPGYCATDLNGNSGFRTAAQGGESITWPLFNSFESGHFYQDGIEHSFNTAIPEEYKKAFE